MCWPSEGGCRALCWPSEGGCRALCDGPVKDVVGLCVLAQ